VESNNVLAPVIALVKRFPILTAIAGFALGGYLLRDFISGNVGDLKVGDCFDPPALAAKDAVVKDVQHHPCSERHGGEVFSSVRSVVVRTVHIRARTRSRRSSALNAFPRTAATPDESSTRTPPTMSST
jgi:hypothetical protein